MSIGDESDDADLTEFDSDSEDDIASIGAIVTKLSVVLNWIDTAF